MAKINAFSGPPKSAKGKRKAAGSSEAGRRENRGETSSAVIRPAISGQRSGPPSVSEPATSPAAVVPPGEIVVIAEEEEEERSDRPLKRRKAAQVADQSSRPLNQNKGKEKVAGRAAPLSRGKGKKRAGSADKWEPAISLEKTASVGNIEVALHIAERAIPPPDLERFNSLSVEALTGRAVRNSMTGVAFILSMRQRIELLKREVHSLLEQLKGLKTELAEVKEEKDLSQAQISSLEEERKLWVDERNVLGAQLASGEEERSTLRARLTTEEVERVRVMAARSKLAVECAELRGKLESESRLKAKFRADCHEAVNDRAKAENALRKERASIKKQRIEAIKRWQARFLQEECLEYSCDLALQILKNCYDFCFPAGSDGPSFDTFANPMLPAALGLSLGEVRERAEEDRGPVPDEELDYSSAEEDSSSCESIPPDAPLDPVPVSTLTPLPALPPAAEVTPGHPPAAEASPGHLPSVEVSPRHSPAAESSRGYSPSPSADF